MNGASDLGCRLGGMLAGSILILLEDERLIPLVGLIGPDKVGLVFGLADEAFISACKVALVIKLGCEGI